MNMNTRLILSCMLCCLFVLMQGELVAQGNADRQKQMKASPRNIFEALEGNAAGQGRVIIRQSESVRRSVGGVSRKYSSVLGREGNTTIVMGYRIQFFNGNLPNSRAEAYGRAAQIRQINPELACYTSYNAPFWKLVVGDYATMEAARVAQRELVSKLPKWAKESYIVRDKVRILNYNSEEYHD